MINISLIGGSGFVGSRFIRAFKDKGTYNLKNIDKVPSLDFNELTVIANVLDKNALKEKLAGTDLVIMLAAEHRDDVTPTSLYYDVNVTGMKNVLEVMNELGIKRIVFTSSVAIYGMDKGNPTEEFEASPFNHYGISKWKAEQVLADWYKEHPDWNINIIRPTVIFGEGNRGNVYNLLKQISSGRFMMIGKGTNEKSMSYVGNIVAFMNFLIEKNSEGYHIYNYSDTPDLSTNDLVFYTGKILNKEIPKIHIPYWLGMFGGYGFDLLAFVTGKKLPISSIRVRKFCANTKYDSRKSKTAGFNPPYTLEEGLKNMLENEFSK
ncbi:NAD-dependent epimerase/dehydratase family protein [Sphingobacterium sp. HJSM2_6]|uniref:NAD-dependent epimerase/dehydratase family protein n=1 Tax=Sphingobacterium sp. HJSM2_6 TaxID=3366264 RepID=UPI003BE116D6